MNKGKMKNLREAFAAKLWLIDKFYTDAIKSDTQELEEGSIILFNYVNELFNSIADKLLTKQMELKELQELKKFMLNYIIYTAAYLYKDNNDSFKEIINEIINKEKINGK